MSMTTQKNVHLLIAAVLSAALVSCSQGGDKKKKNRNDGSEPAETSGGSTGNASPTTGADTTPKPCWDKFLQTPEAKACTTLYTYSGKTCVAGVTKQADCTREVIQQKYGSAQLGDQPAMTVVDGWIGEGFEPNQCATSPDGKLYIYFLKKTFTAGAASGGVDQYQIADKKLGPPDAILNAIVLQNGGTPAQITCD
jgi:hypothetical protein